MAADAEWKHAEKNVNRKMRKEKCRRENADDKTRMENCKSPYADDKILKRGH